MFNTVVHNGGAGDKRSTDQAAAERPRSADEPAEDGSLKRDNYDKELEPMKLYDQLIKS